jgi:hemerythrin-like domain-containing protein
VTKAIDVLMTEHRLIEKVLAALEAHARELVGGRALERGPIRDFSDFFRSYADACHHGKEEDLLFKRMVELGFPKDHGPIAVMLYEHTIGREHVGALRAIGEAAGPVAPDEGALVVTRAAAYVPMLREHILKEDRILYPLAERMLPPVELERLAEQYDDFQARVVGAGAYAEMERLAERLVAAHPFDPAVLEAAHAGVGCHGLG